MALSDQTWQEAITTVLENHKSRETVNDTLLWESPLRTGGIFLSGILLFVVVEVFNLGIMMVVGIVAIAQLLLFRAAKYAQDKKLLFTKRDLKEDFILTPSPETVSTTIEIFGETFRLIEESIKDLALSDDYGKLGTAFMTLVFLAAVGRVLTLSSMLLVIWLLSFTVMPLYKKNQKLLDGAVEGIGGVFGGLTKDKEE